MLNQFGKELRKLRITCNERMLDMAKKIQKSAAFISSIERSEKPIPEKFEEIIINCYNLNSQAANELRSAAAQSRHKFTLEPKTGIGKDMVSLMARRMDSLTDEQIKNIKNILNEG